MVGGQPGRHRHHPPQYGHVHRMGDSAATINQLSLRQVVTPERLLGRVSAGMSMLGQGIGALGMLAGGLLAEEVGLRATVAVAALGVQEGL